MCLGVPDHLVQQSSSLGHFYGVINGKSFAVVVIVMMEGGGNRRIHSSLDSTYYYDLLTHYYYLERDHAGPATTGTVDRLSLDSRWPFIDLFSSSLRISSMQSYYPGLALVGYLSDIHH